MHWFIVPRLDGPITGGTLFNRRLVHALRMHGLPCRVVLGERSPRAVASARVGDWCWLDSLYLGQAPQLAAALRPGARLGLLLHYLPALLADAAARPVSRWPVAERAALRAADAFVVTSPFMGGLVGRLVDHARPIVHVQPGRVAKRPAALVGSPVRAVMVANLVPGKRVAEFLKALARRLRDADRFHLRIVGGTRLDPAYAHRCRQLAAERPLRARVELLGERAPAATVREMAANNLMLSASCMEAYGMALAEARTLGLPILATTGGYVDCLVEQEAGGELTGGPGQLAAACLALARDADEHRRRLVAARAHAWPPRPWSRAAEDWARATRTLAAGDPTKRLPARRGEVACHGG